ncbi:hypothetical protein FHS95_003777 [Sphingomonas naasensis]|uniref:Uncharacterized protein n=1 Tax=Sphingomonas naasensis TaxID=1344951 RepID=A0A4S1WKF6_9SPHN|nr:hypothetical protein [Sphingomonas naasensis]NIJ22066.1 hypothetical protein [Sphingomonas naasensis]TGX42260.1 hypothetical protein E5A74_10415 [Sphingomonas naasensis]
MDDITDIDVAYAKFLTLAKSREDALDQCAAEQAAGRTGLAHYKRAAQLQGEVNAFAARLAAAIERERASI